MIDRRLLRLLGARTYSADQALSAVGLPAQRVREWIKRGLFETIDAATREPGKRRAWRLIDVLGARLFGALTDDENGLALSLPAARDILLSALFGRDLGHDLHAAATVRAARRAGRDARDLYTTVVASAEDVALATERAFSARWLIASRVQYVEPAVSFWRARLSECPELADALIPPFPNPANEPLRLVILEVAPHAERVVDALMEIKNERG
jgi:hypothetical protein